MAKASKASAGDEGGQQKEEKEEAAPLPPSGSGPSKALVLVVVATCGVLVAGVVIKAVGLQKENVELEARLVGMESLHGLEQERIRRQLGKKEKDLVSNQEELAKKQEELADLNKLLANQSKESIREKRSLKDKEDECTAALAVKVGEMEKTEKKIEDLSNEHLHERSVNSLVTEENAEQSKVIVANQKKIEDLEQDLISTKEGHDATLREIQRYHDGAINVLDETVTRQKTQLSESQVHIQDLNHHGAKMESASEELKEKLKVQKAEFLEVQSTLNKNLADTLENAANEKVIILENAKLEREGLSEEKQAEVRSILNVVAEKEAELATASLTVSEKLAEIEKLDRSNKELQNTLNNHQSSLDEKIKTCEEATKQKDEEESQMKMAISNFEVEKTSLDEKIKTCEEASKQKDEEANQLKTTISYFEGERTEHSNMLGARYQELQQKEQELEQEKQKKQELEEQVQQAQTDTGTCLAERAKEAREALAAQEKGQHEKQEVEQEKDRVREECAERARNAQAEQAKEAQERLAATEQEKQELNQEKQELEEQLRVARTRPESCPTCG